MTRELVAAAGIIVTVSLLYPEAQGLESLRARAKAEGGTVTVNMYADYSEYSVAQLVKRADVIVHGRVVGVRPHLTEDESTVVTDVNIDAIQVLKQVTPVNLRARPGATVPLIVRHVGGTVVDQGLKMSTLVDAFPASEAFAVGEEVVFFLLQDASKGVFELVDGPFAAFRVRQGKIHSLTQDAARRVPHDGPPVATFVASIIQQIRDR
ncbi:MAG TPA: hypothetical protein VEL51_22390 [Vicinamibacterales bacterium]|nr:hypothetical protein [Vicinamibacterales bacterium]